MKPVLRLLPLLLCLSVTGTAWLRGAGEPLPAGLQFDPGPVNGALIDSAGSHIAVYRAPSGKPSALLLTHARRDLAEAARASLPNGARIFAPEQARELLENPSRHWEAWWKQRFDYYGQQVTRLPVYALAITDPVREGTSFSLGNLSFRVLETPGYTREGLSYLTELDGKRVAFTGNLLMAGGRVSDLYSFQDQIREARIGAYHGYAARFGPWIESLRKLAAEKPDLIIPSQGPLIRDPAADIAQAISRAQAVYANFVSTNALHWYFGEERMRAAFARVFGPDGVMESMPFCEHIDLPPWVRHSGTTNVLVSSTRKGFVLDVGSPRSLEAVHQMLEDGTVASIDGIWVTHLHNDHTREVAAAQAAFGCPVYATELMAAPLRRPGDFFMPGLTPNAVREVTALPDGHTWTWEEFTFTARWFPGQMLTHGGLLVQKPGEDPVFFIGDSFSPSGIDDYCLMNRNLLREDQGYQRCFRIVREELPAGTWLVNQHIEHLFRFNASEWNYLIGRYRKRIDLLRHFVPLDAVNHAVDEQWCRSLPYGQEASPGDTVKISFQVLNHSLKRRTFEITLHAPEGIAVDAPCLQTSPEAGAEGSCEFVCRLSSTLPPGVHVLTASVRSDDGDIDLPHWSEALIQVVPGR